ncbi:MAG: imidazolonepropionase [Planctomycetota bacterium]|jgi:imidazolonepropionase
MAELLVTNASEIVTCAAPGLEPPYAGKDAGTLGLTSGSIAISDGVIVAIGPDVERDADVVVDAQGGVVFPGFVDCHTHAVFCGSRADEFEQRAKGMPYAEIAREGGGIRKSMRQLREATPTQLLERVRRHYDNFLTLGTTTIEAKSGYGLSVEHELASLEALGCAHELEVVRTCLAAHSVPPEFEARRKDYIDLVINEIFPKVAHKGLAKYCDVFVEKGVFTFEEAETILEAGQRRGLRGRVHADQLTHAGGARLACRVGAITADHLEHATREDARQMRENGVLPVLLPVANYYLDQEERPPARAMVGLNCPFALATDFNPGSAPSQSMPLVINMACVRFGLSIAEAIVGATINAACAIERQGRVGSLEIGKQGDLVVCDIDDHRDIAYYAGGNPVRTVIKNGEVVRGGGGS